MYADDSQKRSRTLPDDDCSPSQSSNRQKGRPPFFLRVETAIAQMGYRCNFEDYNFMLQCCLYEALYCHNSMARVYEIHSWNTCLVASSQMPVKRPRKSRWYTKIALPNNALRCYFLQSQELLQSVAFVRRMRLTGCPWPRRNSLIVCKEEKSACYKVAAKQEKLQWLWRLAAV